MFSKLNVLGVNGGGEVVEQWASAYQPALIEQLQFKLLNVAEPSCVTGKCRKVVADVGNMHLFGQQISLVQEENYGDVREGFVVDDRVENVARLHETICATVFKQDLIIFTRRCEEENRSNIVKALIPTLSLRTLPSDINKTERYTMN